MQDRLEPLICRNVIYTVTDSDETYTGSILAKMRKITLYELIRCKS